MARRQETVTIETEGRDKGKVFVITEMSAIEGEKWASQLMKLIVQSGVPLPEESDADQADGEQGGAAAVASKLNTMELVPILNVLQDPSLEGWWNCVRYQHDPKHPTQAILQGEACQIEEIPTITQLRVAVLKMHTGFFSRGKASTTASPSAPHPTPGSSPTRISRPRSVP